MSAARVGRILTCWWLFVAAVTLATLVGTILWQAFGPVAFRSEAEMLLVLELPPDSEDRQFGIENSRAQASGVIIEDLVRLTRGRELLREAIAALADEGHMVDLETLFKTLDVFPLARGLRIELDWADRVVGQAIVDTMVRLLQDNQTTYYPALPEIGHLRLIDKTDEAIRPGLVLVVLDVVLKTMVALFLAVIVALVVDWRTNRLHAADVRELLEMPVMGSVR